MRAHRHAVTSVVFGSTLLTTLLISAFAFADTDAVDKARIEALEKRLGELETPRPVDDSGPKAPPESSGKEKPPGLLALENDDVSIRLRPIIQLDGRFFGQGGTNTFLARRVRPAIEATFFERFTLRITPELGGGAATVVDAFANLQIIPELQLRFGKFKSPVGLERLQNDADLAFAERGLPSSLFPDRDIGVQVHGEILKGTIAYAGGIFDGALDGQQVDGDVDDRKDIAGRIFLRPFAATDFDLLKHIGFGIAGTRGQHSGALTTYKTAGQQSFFAFATDAVAAGTERRFAPQAYAYVGPVGVMGEWGRIYQAVRRADAAGTASATAASVTVSFVVTGEKASYGTIKPKHVFAPEKGTFGAIELDFRLGRLHVDDDPFARTIADTTKQARTATELAFGVQWHFAPAIKLVANYVQTTFEGCAPAGGDRPKETLFLGRFQVAY